MRANKLVVTLCIAINILAGVAAAFAGGVLIAMTLGFGGSLLEAMWAAPLLLGGVLYACAGVCFALPNQRAWTKGLTIQGLAILLGVTWAIFSLITVQREAGNFNPYDEEVVMFVLLPAAGVLFAIAEFGLLWWIRPRV